MLYIPFQKKNVLERMSPLFKNKHHQVRSGWLIAFALIMVFIGQAIFMMPGLTFVTIFEMSEGEINFSFDPNQMSPWFILLTQGAGTFGGIAATLVVFRAVNKKNPNKLGINAPIKDLFIGLLLGAAAITMIFLLLLVTGNVQLVNAFTSPVISESLLIFLILFVLVGFFEEMFFRGYVIKTMAARGNKKWVIYVVSAVVFGLVHLTNPNVSLFGIVNIILVGLLFAYMFDVTKSLLFPIGFHITWNYFQGAIFGFPVSGTPPFGMYVVDVSQGNDLLTGGSFGLEGGAFATFMLIICFFITRLYAKKRHVNHS